MSPLEMRCALPDYCMDGIRFTLKKQYELGFLSKYGRMFCVFAENDSGNISFGFDDGQEKRFVKVAGLETAEFKGNPEDAVRSLERAIPLYSELRHSLPPSQSPLPYPQMYASEDDTPLER